MIRAIYSPSGIWCVLYYIGATVNPLLYNLMSKKYRMAFKRTLCRCIYTQEELIELSVRSKSVLVYSDRTPNSRWTVYRSNQTPYDISLTLDCTRVDLLWHQYNIKHLQIQN
jgi:hypothetical protein